MQICDIKIAHTMFAINKDLKYYEMSKDLETFSRAYFTSKSDQPHHRPQLTIPLKEAASLLWYFTVILCGP